MTIYKIVFVVFIFLFFSCRKQEEKRSNQISKIYITTGLCYGYCPVRSIEIDSTLNVKYYGANYAKYKGHYIGKITAKTWDSINSKFEKIKYKELDSVYDNSVDDPPVYLKIYYQNKIKTVRAQSASLPKDVKKTYLWLIEIVESTKLNKTNDSLNFDKENLKFIQPPPPPPYELYEKMKVEN